MTKFFLSLFITSLIFTSSFAQDGKKEDKVFFTVHFRNGDIITGKSKVKTLIVSTDYGPLAFPVQAIKSIKLGINNPNIDKDNITKLADKLNSTNPEEQLGAYESLCKQEAGAISVLKEYMTNDKYLQLPNCEYTVPNVIQTLQANYGVDNKSPMNDIVTYDETFTAQGTCNLSETIDIETAFGTLQIPRKDINDLDVNYEPAEEASVSKNYLLAANKNISGNADGGFFNTGITLKAGRQFSISATGKVTLASLSNNSYTPDGGINGSPAPADGGTNTPSYGSVVFRVGETGPIIKAGAAYKGKATDSGILYIGIYETVFNANNSGTYKVKVKTE